MVVHMQMFKRVSGTVSSEVVVLLLSLVMGMYFVAQVLLWRMNLPLKYRCVVCHARHLARDHVFSSAFLINSPTQIPVLLTYS